MTHSFPTRRSSDPSLGVDISQNCGVTGFLIAGGKVRGCQTSLGTIGTGNVGMAVAGHSTALAAKAGVRLPISSYALQAFVSEPVQPCLDTVVLSPATGTYLRQSAKGALVIGAGPDIFLSYAHRVCQRWRAPAAPPLG